jgi:nicotinamidase-related amidase
VKPDFDPRSAVLLIVDVQRAIDDPSWGRRNNPQAEENIGRLLAVWRRASRAIVHVRHESTEPGSTYRPGQPGCGFKDVVTPQHGETILTKHTNSAFIGTDLERRLRTVGCSALVICGVITNNSVEATARMAGNLGFNTYVVADATATFDKADFSGRMRTADEVHAMSLANLSREYATIVSTNDVLKWDPSKGELKVT